MNYTQFKKHTNIALLVTGKSIRFYDDKPYSNNYLDRLYNTREEYNVDLAGAIKEKEAACDKIPADKYPKLYEAGQKRIANMKKTLSENFDEMFMIENEITRRSRYNAQLKFKCETVEDLVKHQITGWEA